MDETSSWALYEGVMLERKYAIQNVIGVGGFGIIYLAEDINLKLKVAIKEYFPFGIVTRISKDDLAIHALGGKYEQQYSRGLKQFEQEANHLFLFRNCDGVVDILNFFYANNTAYIVMEYVFGNNLREYLERNGGKMHLNEACKLIRPVIESLEIVHKSGIVHCDISPDNIMITEEGNVKIIDFGSAYSIEAHNEERSILLKRGYSPPELYQEKGKIGSWSDVYSVCATLFRMITGERVPELLVDNQGSDIKLLLKQRDNTLPIYLVNTIEKGLDRSVEQRIQNMTELLEYLLLKKSISENKKIYPKALFVGCCVLGMLMAGSILFSLKKQTVDDNNISTDDGSGSSFDIQVSNKTDMEWEKDHYNTQEIVTIQEDKIQYTDKSHFSYEENDDGIIIIGSDGETTELLIPEQIDGRDVIKISGVGGNVTNIVIPDTVVQIDPYAFRNCAYLKEIYIPDSVEKIGTGAFDNCFSLSDITVEDNSSYFYVLNGVLYSVGGEVVYVIDSQ